MATSKFTADAREAVYAVLGTGGSIGDAARAAGIAGVTLKEWLRLGRHNPNDIYTSFATQCDRLREQARAQPAGDDSPMDRDELLAVASKAARGGSTQGMRIVAGLLSHPPPPDDPSVEQLPAGEAIMREMDQVAAFRRDHPEAGPRALPRP